MTEKHQRWGLPDGGTRPREVPAGGPTMEDRATVEEILGDPPDPCDCGERRMVTLWERERHSWAPVASLCLRCRAERFDWDEYFLEQVRNSQPD